MIVAGKCNEVLALPDLSPNGAAGRWRQPQEYMKFKEKIRKCHNKKSIKNKKKHVFFPFPLLFVLPPGLKLTQGTASAQASSQVVRTSWSWSTEKRFGQQTWLFGDGGFRWSMVTFFGAFGAFSVALWGFALLLGGFMVFRWHLCLHTLWFFNLMFVFVVVLWFFYGCFMVVSWPIVFVMMLLR